MDPVHWNENRAQLSMIDNINTSFIFWDYPNEFVGRLKYQSSVRQIDAIFKQWPELVFSFSGVQRTLLFSYGINSNFYRLNNVAIMDWKYGSKMMFP